MNHDSLQALLNDSLENPQVLDQLWAAYQETGNTDCVLKIVSVLDFEDRTRNYLETWLQECSDDELNEYQERLIKWVIPIKYDERTVDGPLDLDLHVALLAKDGQLKFDQLPMQIPMPDLIRLSMKSAALWSLLSVANSDPTVAEVCIQQAAIPGGAARIHLARAKED